MGKSNINDNGILLSKKPVTVQEVCNGLDGPIYEDAILHLKFKTIPILFPDNRLIVLHCNFPISKVITEEAHGWISVEYEISKFKGGLCFGLDIQQDLIKAYLMGELEPEYLQCVKEEIIGYYVLKENIKSAKQR